MKPVLLFLKKHWYPLFKYAVYLSVLSNVFLFLKKELAASAHRFGADFSIFQVFEAFTSTLDTAAWVVLLLLFELETYILPKSALTPTSTRIIRIITGLCFLMICTSFLGYLQSYFWLQGYAEIDINNLCEVIGQSWMIELDEFKTIESGTCAGLAESTTFYKHASKAIYTDDVFLKATNWLAGINVLNSISWILVVILLEIDVIFRQQKQTTKFSNYFKNMLYLSLLLCAIYWGIYGDFLEFWDAFLWIVAFVFIELNLLGWGNQKQPGLPARIENHKSA